ncbi:MAG: phosphoadenosine phosphosulfate reductase family protein [Candidatus Paceibacterota bacterium]
MKDLYRNIKHIADSIDQAVVFYSTGKDATAMLNLFHRFMPGRFKTVFLYFFKGLSIRERMIAYYERRYKIKIDQYPQFDVSSLYSQASITNQKKIKMKDVENFIRDKYNLPFLAYGYRKDESLERRGMLAHIDDGIEWKYKKLYPLADWSAKDVFNYLKHEKLPLPPDYPFGFRDINTFKGDALLWLVENYPEDYEMIKAQYPLIEAELIRARETVI